MRYEQHYSETNPRVSQISHNVELCDVTLKLGSSSTIPFRD